MKIHVVRLRFAAKGGTCFGRRRARGNEGESGRRRRFGGMFWKTSRRRVHGCSSGAEGLGGGGVIGQTRAGSGEADQSRQNAQSGGARRAPALVAEAGVARCLWLPTQNLPRHVPYLGRYPGEHVDNTYYTCTRTRDLVTWRSRGERRKGGRGTRAQEAPCRRHSQEALAGGGQSSWQDRVIDGAT